MLVEGLRGREAANWSRRRVATQGQFLIVLDELEGLLLSATVNGGTLVNVHDWLSDNTSPERVAIQEQHGYNLHARSLKGLHASAVETRSSVTFTARTATRCLRHPGITSWVTPHPRGRPCSSSTRRRSPSPARPCTCSARTALPAPAHWSRS